MLTKIVDPLIVEAITIEAIITVAQVPEDDGTRVATIGGILQVIEMGGELAIDGADRTLTIS